MSTDARRKAGILIGKLQEGQSLPMPVARPMPSIGKRCLELRINDGDVTWRIMCRTDPDAVLVLDWFAKKTTATPQSVLELCRKRLADYDNLNKKERR